MWSKLTLILSLGSLPSGWQVAYPRVLHPHQGMSPVLRERERCWMGRGSHPLHLAWQGVASHTSASMIHPKFNFMPQSLAHAVPFDCDTLPYLIHV